MKMVSFDVFPHLNMIPGSDANFDKILANIHLSMDQTQKWSNKLMKKIPRNPEKEVVGEGSNETRNLDLPLPSYWNEGASVPLDFNIFQKS